MAATRGHIAGVYHAQICKRSGSGYPHGTAADPDTVANGTVMSAYKLLGAVSATAPAPTYETAEFFGGQTYLGSADLGATAFGAFEITLSAHDDTFHALVTNTAVDTTIASANSVTAYNAGLTSPPQLFLILTLGYQKEDGTNWHIHYIYNNVQIRPGNLGSASNSGGTNPNPNTYSVRIARSARTIFGYLYEDTTLAVADDLDIMTVYKSQRPIHVVSFIGDGTVGTTGGDELPLPYLPVSSDATGALRNVITKDGALQAATTVATATGLVTYTTISANATENVLVYETNFVSA